MGVTFEDYSVNVKTALNDAAISFLYAAAAEVEADAKRNCQMEDDVGIQLRASYQGRVDESKGVATIGTPLEAGYWEEFGTGEYAATDKNGGKKGRQGWWVYVKNSPPGDGGISYNTQAEAQATAASMRADGLDAYATNGRRPAYTLENAFRNKQGVIQRLAEQHFGELGD